MLPIASGRDLPETVKIHQDATFYVSSLNAGDAVTHEMSEKRRAFLYVIEGEITLNGEVFKAGDQARITSESQLALAATNNGEIILIDLP